MSVDKGGMITASGISLQKWKNTPKYQITHFSSTDIRSNTCSSRVSTTYLKVTIACGY